MDHIVPANECHDDKEDTEPSPDDVQNSERLADDNFNMEILIEKDKEIETLKKLNEEQEKAIKHLTSKSKESIMENTAVNLPNLHQEIHFQEAGKQDFVLGKVKNKNKKNSKFSSIVNITLEDGTIKAYDFKKDVVDWKDASTDDNVQENVDICCPKAITEENDIVHDTYATILTKAQVKDRPEAQKAIEDEIKKFQNFEAFEEINDEGQAVIKTRWVFTQQDDDSKGYLIKARLCMRGDKEENVENIRADSPTTAKDTLKLVLAIAANENFDIFSGDITSEFLQGKSLDRDVFVLPPPEANKIGKLWRLKKGAYGLIDGARLFYLELREVLQKLGLRNVSGDPALFTYHKDGKLEGVVCFHVDDIFAAGTPNFKSMFLKELRRRFKFSKVDKYKFKYLGCEVEKLPNGDIELNQNEYISKIAEVDCSDEANSSPVNEVERKTIRRVVGELLWVSLMTRPDLSFEVNRLSSVISIATVKDLKDSKRLVERAKKEPMKMSFTHLGSKENLRVKLYTDASFNNQDLKLRSTEGRILMLENPKTHKVNIFSWKTKKIVRICRSVKGAETRALENGLDDAVHYARMVHEIYSGKVNLKQPQQIEVRAKTDNKSLWESLHNTRQCEEKLLRNSIALMKEMLDCGEVKNIEWVQTNDMLADTLTKRGGNNSSIRTAISENTL